MGGFVNFEGILSFYGFQESLKELEYFMADREFILSEE